MSIKSSEKTNSVKLEENETFSFKKPEIITVESGKIWLTVEGDSKDYFFGDGDIFHTPGDKHAVIQALGKSSFWF
jgi:uncharacterized protein YaiE (UPF0345 family)